MLPGTQAAAALVGRSNPAQWQLLLEAGSSPASMQLEHTRETVHCSARREFCLAESFQGSCPALGHEAQQGLSSAQPCVRGAEAGAQGISDSHRSALPLCLLMDHRSLYECFYWAKSLVEDTPTSSAPKSHSLHISCVSNPSTVPISAARAFPSLLWEGAFPSPSVSKCSSWEMLCSQWIWPLPLESLVLKDTRSKAEPTSLITGFKWPLDQALNSFLPVIHVSQQPQLQCSLHIQHRSHPPHFL